MRSEKGARGQDRSFVERARREQLVGCAVEAIAELGYGAASLAEVARRAGVSKSLVLYHFAGKDELVDEAVRQVYTTAEAFLAERLREDLPPRQWLRDYITECVRFVGAHRVELVALGEIFVGRRSRPGGPEFDGITAEPERHLAAQLRRGQRDGAFRDFSVLVVARAIRAALDDVAQQYGADPTIDLDALAAELVDLFDRATRGRKRLSTKGES